MSPKDLTFTVPSEDGPSVVKNADETPAGLFYFSKELLDSLPESFQSFDGVPLVPTGWPIKIFASAHPPENSG